MQKISVTTKEDIKALEQRAVVVAKKSNFKITSQETLTQANEVMKTLKVAKKYITEQKASVIGPLLLATKNTRELFRPIEEKINGAEYTLKAGVLAYKKTVDEAIAKQKEKIEKKVEAGETTFEKASEKIEKVEAKTDEFKTQKRREIEITDESKIPQEYYKLDLVLLRKDALAGKEIAGVKVVVKEVVRM